MLGILHTSFVSLLICRKFNKDPHALAKCHHLLITEKGESTEKHTVWFTRTDEVGNRLRNERNEVVVQAEVDNAHSLADGIRKMVSKLQVNYVIKGKMQPIPNPHVKYDKLSKTLRGKLGKRREQSVIIRDMLKVDIDIGMSDLKQPVRNLETQRAVPDIDVDLKLNRPVFNLNTQKAVPDFDVDLELPRFFASGGPTPAHKPEGTNAEFAHLDKLVKFKMWGLDPSESSTEDGFANCIDALTVKISNRNKRKMFDPTQTFCTSGSNHKSTRMHNVVSLAMNPLSNGVMLSQPRPQTHWNTVLQCWQVGQQRDDEAAMQASDAAATRWDPLNASVVDDAFNSGTQMVEDEEALELEKNLDDPAFMISAAVTEGHEEYESVVGAVIEAAAVQNATAGVTKQAEGVESDDRDAAIENTTALDLPRGLSRAFKKRQSYHAFKMLPVVTAAIHQNKKRWNVNGNGGKGTWDMVAQVPDDCWWDFNEEARKDEEC
jgi:hypothetical protein